MTDKLQGGLKDHAIRFDNFLGDIFGLNITGLKSIWAAITAPARYFTAAQSPDWEDSYTPSVRLWFSIIAFTFFLRFIWGHDDTAIMQFMVAQLQQANVSLPEGVTYQMAASSMARWTFAYTPFTYLLCLFLLGIIWPFWGRKMPLALKARYVYATVIPSTVLGIFTSLGMAWITHEQFVVYSFASMFIVIVIDSSTAWRGAFTHLGAFSKLWRSILLGLTLAFTYILASGFAQIAASYTIRVIYGNGG